MPDSVPLVFVHGFMGRASDWEAIRSHFTRETQAPDVHGVSLDEAADGLLETYPGPVILLGYSMGARLALHAAVRHPERVWALVLESGMPGLEGETERLARRTQDKTRAAALQREGMQPFLEAWYAQPLFSTLGEHRTQLIQERSSLDPAMVAQQLCALSVAQQPNHWLALQNLSMPVLALAGSLDHKYAAVAERIASTCPQGQCVIIDQAGHNVHLERPDAYVAAVKTFLTHIGDD
ncbi:MAG: 2-succinyl-6-hydroxy-2,4-cyclohexadiene-1-carboxylate synthase [Kiritimatiellia bacterium]|jgi:2-succinyl-6-hydroxy-2,4-cyclohexadiene-1-carboxylate synthase